ncbi:MULTISPECIES: siderophore-interacting protein [unclassified Nocardioides]|uniref:siderophore-interacting protein n=1 Tax=unclassified Nocardioides TaxID=2615069 RepID=UPI0009EFD2BF|nr:MULTISPECIES: siderophore-interacting protein [unclassified Nocardioides]GAW49006.1 Siderophore utilization protein [Nocardioides sp. PD653-B2]GAW57222.1 Siderophore utilization protein [Nocardioides sp. PD653]
MPGPTSLVVTATERRSPSLVRVRFRTDDLSAFADSVFTDRYVKLAIPSGGGEVVRTYTALEPDLEARTLAIDFVVHGDEGVAGPWAAGAAPGDTLTVRGPGGAYAPDPAADWHLFAGDESAIPAIGAAIEALPAGATAYALLEVSDPDHEVDLPAPPGVEITWLHRGAGSHAVGDDAAGLDAPLVGAVRSLPWRDGRVQAFVHGEAAAVMHGIRPYLLEERNLPRGDVSISGYWRRGRTEEGFRAWKSELAAAETAG